MRHYTTHSEIHSQIQHRASIVSGAWPRWVALVLRTEEVTVTEAHMLGCGMQWLAARENTWIYIGEKKRETLNILQTFPP